MVEDEILAQIDSEDKNDGSVRVLPMAVVRCSRGKNTRSLYEIARIMRRETCSRDPIAVLFVSFNDFSSLLPDEQKDPLQALCQRIAYLANPKRTASEDIQKAFANFQLQGNYRHQVARASSSAFVDR